jgi:hypothetical protein
MSEQEQYIPLEARFSAMVTERLNLWREHVEEAEIDQEVKDKILTRLAAFSEQRFNFVDLGNDCYNLVAGLLSITDSAKSETAKTLFEDLRGDIWAFLEEVSELT